MVRVVSGYTGGQLPSPSYFARGDHTEALLIEFDPSQTSYREMLKEWMQLVDPYKKKTCQYRSAVWYLNDQQQAICQQFLQQQWGKTAINNHQSSKQLQVCVEKATSFYQAEEFHQNFRGKTTVSKKL